MMLKDKVYDVLKWLCIIALPAAAVLYNTLAGVWGWPYAHEVTTTLEAVALFLGALIGISTYHYYHGEGGPDGQ